MASAAVKVREQKVRHDKAVGQKRIAVLLPEPNPSIRTVRARPDGQKKEGFWQPGCRAGAVRDGRCCRKKPRHNWLCYWGAIPAFQAGRCRLIGEHLNGPAKPLTQLMHTLHLLAGRVDAAP